MRIIIRSLRDNPFFIEVDEQATIFCVKSAIFQINGVFPSHQSIIYQGNVLSNETTLPSLNFPTNKQASLYLVISKKQRERLQEEQEQKESYSSKSLPDSHPKPDLFSSSPNSINQGLGIQNNACFDSIMKNITDKSPNFSHALNDKEALYESYDAFRDPGKRLELLKSIDRTLNLVESKAGCYRDIIEHQRLVTEAVDDAIDKYMHEVNPKYYETLNKTVIPEKPLDAPSCEPIEMDLNQSENFMDSLLQRQLMLVMTLPNGTQKLVTVKKNTDAVLKIMQLMANLQEKSQKNKMKKDNENLKPINSFFGTENNTSSFDFDTNNDSCDNENSNENEGNFGFGNGLKQLEIDNQLNLLKILMMSILSDENRDNNNDNENKSNPFFHSGIDNNKNDNLFDEEFESDSNRNNQSIFGWNGLFGENIAKNNKTKNNVNNNAFQKQPKYEQVFHKSEPSPPPTQSSQLLFDMDSETDSQSNFCFSSNSDFQSFDEDDDCFFNNDYFTKNSPTSFNSGSFVQPRSNGHRNTTYYSPTADSIRTTREERKSILDYKNEKRFNFNCDESNNNNNNSDENVMEDQNDIEEKRRKGWKMIYDLVNTSQGCDLEEEEEQNIKDNNNNNHDNDEYQNTFNFNEDEDDSSDISID